MFSVLNPEDVTEGNAAGQLVRLARTPLPFILRYPASLGQDGVAVLARVRLVPDDNTMQYLLGVVDDSRLIRFYATRHGPRITATWRLVENGSLEENVTWTFNTGSIDTSNDSSVYISFGIQFEQAVLLWHNGACPQGPTAVFGVQSSTEDVGRDMANWTHYQVRERQREIN